MSKEIVLSMTGLFLVVSPIVAGETKTGGSQGQSFRQRETLTGDWDGWRSRMTEEGIEFSPVFIGEVMSDVSGGLYGPGTVYDQSLNLPLTMDLEKLAGWPAAIFHVNAFWIAGESLTEKCVGDIANVSNISADPALRLQELWLQQGFWQQTVSLKVGLIAADNEFFGADAGVLFINGAFGAFPLIAANLLNPPIYPMAAPAASLRLQPVSGFYFQTAIFDGDSGTQDGNPSGTNFPLSKEDGALIFSEIGLLSAQDSDTNHLERVLKLGGVVNTKRVPTWNSQIAGNTGGGQINAGGYAVIEQDLYRRAGKHIAAFVRGGYASADRNAVDWYVDAGFNFSGWVPGRGNDVAGIAFARSNFSRDYSHYEEMVNGQSIADAEYIVEATYRTQITPWWALQPDLQYIIAPGGAPDCEDAVVLGLRTTIVF